jgi:hypothetical protein
MEYGGVGEKESPALAKKRLTLLSGSWQYFDLLIVVGALLLGIGIWFIPSVTSSPDVQKLFAQQRQIAAEIKEQKAEEARVKKEQEDIGLVFVAPAVPKKQPPADAKKPAKPKDK